ncbi:MAG: hypothetical protein M1838_004905 [Thelocarpon superellum]|nr:MAG: hypothetical protein M1838_004905 [Thelocarpon superellum]
MWFVATAKGLVAGAIVITRKDGSTVSCAEDAQGLLIPNVREIRSIDVSAVAWVLVLEKEAAFRSLAVDLLWRQDGGGRGGVLVTGKGYPDISTRAFLHILATQFPAGLAPPIFALVDLDPDGVSIMSTYKYGSAALAHENAHLHVPGLQWLGVHSADLSEAAFSQEEDGRLSLTARDRRRATKLLGKDIFAEDGPERLWRREVQVMLMMNWKAEIQMLGRAEGGLATYLDARLAITAGAGHG